MKKLATFQHDSIQCFKFGSNPFGAPRMFSHIYFVDGLLIDTGHSNMRREVMASIDHLPVEQIFLTHHHEDHTGNLAAVQARFDCPTFASPKCIEMMKAPPRISLAQWLTWGNRPANFDIAAADQQISTEHYHFEIIPTPGHAADMVCLYESKQGWLFSADLWVANRIKIFMRAESMKQQIESLRRVLQLEFDVLLCGHNPKVSDGKIRIEKKLHFFEEFYGNVAQLYHQGLSANAIMRALEIRERWFMRLLSTGELSTMNMVKSVIRDEQKNE